MREASQKGRGLAVSLRPFQTQRTNNVSQMADVYNKHFIFLGHKGVHTKMQLTAHTLRTELRINRIKSETMNILHTLHTTNGIAEVA